MIRICTSLFGTSVMIAMALMPSAATSEDTNGLPERFDCLFQPHIGGRLIDGGIISPDSRTFIHAPVAISFVIKDAITGEAIMQFGKQPAQAVPARREVRERVVRFSYEFPGLSAGSATISRTPASGSFPAVRSDQGWYDDVLSVGYSSGLCRPDDPDRPREQAR